MMLKLAITNIKHKNEKCLLNASFCRMFFPRPRGTRYMHTRPLITSIGEALVDFVSTSAGPLSRSVAFIKALGGEGANVAVGLARLGSRSAFVGKVGDDPFGRFLVDELRRSGVETSGVVFDRRFKTRLAFVSLARDGERDFAFWEKVPAGEQLRTSDIQITRLRSSRIVNIAALLLPKQPARTTAFAIADEALRAGSIVAFDANIRRALWASAAEAQRVMRQMIRRSTILRLNQDEAHFLTGRKEQEAQAAAARSLGPSLVAITLGARGSYFQSASASGFVPGFRVKAVDTTGCGDAFFAGLLHRLAQSKRPVGDLSREELTSMCAFANAVGALTALRRGGAAAIPTMPTVVKFLAKNAFHDR